MRSSRTSAHRLTTAGFTTLAAASFLLAALAIFAFPAGATHGTPTPLGSAADPWDQNVGICHRTGNGGFVANHPGINANNIPAIAGHSSHVGDIVPPFFYDHDNNDNTPGVLSTGVNFSGANVAIWANGCVAPTTTPPSTSTTPPTTSTTPPSTTETTPPGTTSTTPPGTTSTTPPGTTTEPPSTSTSVQPTTVTPTESTTPPDGTTVSPTSVTPPGGTAFTGLENVIPLGVIAVGLMTAGSGLLWAGSRRGRRDDGE
jgi:hypothetical protein